MKKLALLISMLSLGCASVDINHASLSELQKLNGVGVKTAQSILEYKKQHGCFTSIDALTKVKGIGKKTIEKNSDILQAKPCK